MVSVVPRQPHFGAIVTPLPQIHRGAILVNSLCFASSSRQARDLSSPRGPWSRRWAKTLRARCAWRSSRAKRATFASDRSAATGRPGGLHGIPRSGVAHCARRPEQVVRPVSLGFRPHQAADDVGERRPAPRSTSRTPATTDGGSRRPRRIAWQSGGQALGLLMILLPERERPPARSVVEPRLPRIWRLERLEKPRRPVHRRLVFALIRPRTGTLERGGLQEVFQE